ncbi:hypothetical protein [Streptomyces rubiginosohelvolus]|uniref:hypothetical protein n=1 Tax=Streptomyces rubiginosohelvolus TaxID=67362 RepID=UPI0035DBCA1A
MSVTPCCPRRPERFTGGLRREGRARSGLLLVEALSARWGMEHGPHPRKTVRAEVALTGS